MPELPDEPTAAASAPPEETELVRALRLQVVRDQVRILELDDAVAERDTEAAATRELLRAAQAELDLALSETRSLTKQRDDLANEIPHIRHHLHVAGLELEKAHAQLRDAYREKDEWIARHAATESQLAGERSGHEATRAALAAKQAELDHVRTALETAVREAHALLAASERTSADRAAEVLRHAERIRELDAAVAHLQAVRTDLEKLRDTLRADQTALRAELAQTREQLGQREAKLRTMQASFSWRVTAPLRWLRRVVLRQ